METKRFVGGLSACWVALGVAACAHTEVPPETVARSEGAARAAQEAGANEIPTAALFLKLAREQMDEAKRLSEKGDERAPLVYARARADAEMALALAQEKSEVQEAQALRDEGARNENL